MGDFTLLALKNVEEFLLAINRGPVQCHDLIMVITTVLIIFRGVSSLPGLICSAEGGGIIWRLGVYL